MEFKTVILLTIKRFEILKEFEIIHQRPRNALICSQVRKLIENWLITYNLQPFMNYSRQYLGGDGKT